MILGGLRALPESTCFLRESRPERAKPAPLDLLALKPLKPEGASPRSTTAAPSSAGDRSPTAASEASRCFTTASPELLAELEVEPSARSQLNRAVNQTHARLVPVFLAMAGVLKVESSTVKILLKTLKFLTMCEYEMDDIQLILAHACCYFHTVYDKCGTSMDRDEMDSVLVTALFLAHCHVQDETCPLKFWHQHLLPSYCELKVLNAAVMQIMAICNYQLRLRDDDLETRLAMFESAVDGV